jgi:hypothetical protein
MRRSDEGDISRAGRGGIRKPAFIIHHSLPFVVARSVRSPYDTPTMTTTRPPRPVNTPRRALYFTVGLLAAMLAMAYSDTRDVAPVSLSEPVTPPSWRVQFAHPRGWQDHGDTLGPLGGRFRSFTTTRDDRRMSFGRVSVPSGESAETVCLEVLKATNPLPMLGAPRDVHVREAPFGDWTGVQLTWTPVIMGEVLGTHVFLLGAIAPEDAPAAPEASDLSERAKQREAYILEFRCPYPLRDKDRELWDMLKDGLNTDSGAAGQSHVIRPPEQP